MIHCEGWISSGFSKRLKVCASWHSCTFLSLLHANRLIYLFYCVFSFPFSMHFDRLIWLDLRRRLTHFGSALSTHRGIEAGSTQRRKEKAARRRQEQHVRNKEERRSVAAIDWVFCSFFADVCPFLRVCAVCVAESDSIPIPSFHLCHITAAT